MPFETVVLKTIEYLSKPAVVGHEGFFLRYLQKDFAALGLNAVLYDGLLEVSGAKPRSAIVTAHADRHGLISLGNGEYAYASQYVKEIKYGENNDLSQVLLENIAKRFVDEIVYAYDPATGEQMTSGTISACTNSMSSGDSIFHLRKMPQVPQNTPLAYARSAVTEGPYLKGQIDNTVSLGVLYTLFQNGYQGTALFSTEEEIGYSYKHIIAWLDANEIETKELIVIDTSPYKEDMMIKEGRVTLRTRDKSSMFNLELCEKIRAQAEKLEIPYQVKDIVLLEQGVEINGLGSTELGKISLNSDGRVNGATIQVPTLEYHTSSETTSRACIENYYKLLYSVLVGGV